MRVCGVEIKKGEVVLCILQLDAGLFELPPCRVRSFPIKDAQEQESLKAFQFSFAKLMEDYQVDQVAILGRQMRGKQAGDAAGFKMEAAIQLMANLPVEVISSTEVKECFKRNPMTIDFKATGLRRFQEQAFNAAFTLQQQLQYN